MNQTILKHPILGDILLKTNKQAKRFILRFIDNQLVVTMPPFATRNDLSRMLEEQLESIRNLAQKQPTITPKPSPLKIGMSLPLSSFVLEVEEAPFEGGFEVISRREKILFRVSKEFNFDDLGYRKAFQERLIAYVKKVAPLYLPQRMQRLAKEQGISIGTISITHGKRRLGACDIVGNLQLSYYLMLMPVELSDYIMLHELAHRTHMDHSPAFYHLLDRYVMGKNHSLKVKLKQWQYPL